MMNHKEKSNIRSKTRLAYGLVNVLNFDIDNLRKDIYECDPITMSISLSEINETLEHIRDTIAEIEYVLYLHNTKGSH